MKKKMKRTHKRNEHCPNPAKPEYKALKAPGYIWSGLRKRCENAARNDRDHALWFTDIAFKIRDALNDQPFSESETLRVDVEVMFEKRHADWIERNVDLEPMRKKSEKENPAVKEAADRIRKEQQE